jgi:GTP1/Obg family GTP-binding protein
MLGMVMYIFFTGEAEEVRLYIWGQTWLHMYQKKNSFSRLNFFLHYFLFLLHSSYVLLSFPSFHLHTDKIVYGILSYKCYIYIISSPSQGSKDIVKDGIGRLQEPEIREDWSKVVSSGDGRMTTLMNSCGHSYWHNSCVRPSLSTSWHRVGRAS